MGDTIRAMGPIGEKAFANRQISHETAARYGVYTARQAGGEWWPDIDGNVIAFPFFERGIEVNTKYRLPGKKFLQSKGGRRTFWNSDALDDPSLATGLQALVITEGELDALTAIDCGFPLTVSVPDGAPPARGELEPLDPTQEATGKFEFLYNNRERLRLIQRFILAVDNDPPGQRLAEELTRRLRSVRCSFVEYPSDCKDLNDVRVKWGAEGVTEVLNRAKPYPVQGLYRLSEYPDAVAIDAVGSGWPLLDMHFKLFPGEFFVVTGIPSHGKSQWCLNLLVNLANHHGWRSAIFGPEMPTVPHTRDILRKMVGGTAAAADAWIENWLLFVDTDPSARVEQEPDLDWILDRATDAVERDGIRVLLIDPWNEVEHARRQSETVPEYIGRCIRKLKRWGKLYGVAVGVVAHPTKDVSDVRGKVRAPNLYDIDGAAHWFNKCDHGIVVERIAETSHTKIHMSKVKFQPATGIPGAVTMLFDSITGTFGPLQPAFAGGEMPIV